MRLAQLTRVDPRDFWKHEAFDFTPWLAQPENIKLLADELGIGIHVAQTEASVGPFRADIVAREAITGAKIIIENQLEATDHSHLGQLITYAAGFDADTVIWVVRDVRDEHLQAIKWINEHTDARLKFFIVRIELWKIEDSPLAPKFSVVSHPNQWRQSRTSGERPDSIGAKQREFVQKLHDYCKTNYGELDIRIPRYQGYWRMVDIGRSDCFISLVLVGKKNLVDCALYIPDSVELYDVLYKNRERIDRELDLGEPLKWRIVSGKNARRINAMHTFQFDDDSTWESAFAWTAETACRFKRVFTKDWSQHSQQPVEGDGATVEPQP